MNEESKSQLNPNLQTPNSLPISNSNKAYSTSKSQIHSQSQSQNNRQSHSHSQSQISNLNRKKVYERPRILDKQNIQKRHLFTVSSEDED